MLRPYKEGRVFMIVLVTERWFFEILKILNINTLSKYDEVPQIEFI